LVIKKKDTHVMFGCNKDSHTSIHTAKDCFSQAVHYVSPSLVFRCEGCR